jgi:hypothetical protein
VAAESVAGVMEVDVTHFNGTAGTFSSGRPEVNTTHIAGSSVSTSSAQIGVNVVNAGGTAWGSGAITAASLAADAITAAKLAADVTTELQSGLATSSALSTLQSTADAIETDTQDIQNRLPAALTAGGNIKADALAISGSTESADRLERSTLAIVTGTCDSGGSTTSIVASALSPTSAVNDQYNGRIIIFDKDTTTTALRGQATDITDYVHATLTFTVTALTTAPASGDTFTIT